MSIKRGVSLYSFQDEYVRGKMSVEDCVAVSASLGANGIETLAEQMFPGFPMPGQPDLPPSFYEHWAQLMSKYGTVSTVHDMFLDTKRFAGRAMTHEEMLESVKRDIRHTAKIGGQGIRVIVNTPPEVVEAAAPYAQEHGIWLGVEIHSPYSFRDDWIKRHLDVAQRYGAHTVGCVLDLGIFVHRFPRVIRDRALRDGANDRLVKEIVSTYDERGDVQGLFDKLSASGTDSVTLGLARNATFMIAEDPGVIGEYAEFIRHVHAKFYEMMPADDTGAFSHEYSIPYHEIIPALQKAGYNGYLSSEYEGNRHIEDAETVNSVEQITRHQTMMAALLGEEVSENVQ